MIRRAPWVMIGLLSCLTARAETPEESGAAPSPCGAFPIQLPAEEPSCASAGPDPSNLPEATRKVAREHLDRGLDLLNESRFEEALGEFQAAYAVVGLPFLLVNQAVAYAGLCRPAEAKAAFERFLAEAGSSMTGECHAWVGQCTEILARRAEATAPIAEAAPPPATATAMPRATVPPTTKAPEPAPSNRRRTIAYVVGGLGLATTVVGVALTATAIAEQSDAADRRRNANADFAAPDASDEDKANAHAESLDAEKDYDSADSQRKAGLIVIGIGAAAVVTGVVLLVGSRTESAPSEKARLGWSTWLSATDGGVALTGTW